METQQVWKSNFFVGGGELVWIESFLKLKRHLKYIQVNVDVALKSRFRALANLPNHCHHVVWKQHFRLYLH